MLTLITLDRKLLIKPNHKISIKINLVHKLDRLTNHSFVLKKTCYVIRTKKKIGQTFGAIWCNVTGLYKIKVVMVKFAHLVMELSINQYLCFASLFFYQYFTSHTVCNSYRSNLFLKQVQSSLHFISSPGSVDPS